MRDDQESRLLFCCLSLLGNTGMYVCATSISGYLTIILIILCSFLCMTLRCFFEKSLGLLFMSIRGFYETKVFMTLSYENFHIIDYKKKMRVFIFIINLLRCFLSVCYHSIPMSLYICVISYSSFHIILYLILCLILIKI